MCRTEFGNYGFGFTDDHKYSMAEVLAKHGIEYINTPFDNMYNSKEVQHGLFGSNSGVITVDRGEDLHPWNTIGRMPKGELHGPTCGMHWSNVLHSNPERNSEIVDKWVKLLQPYNDRLNTNLSQNSLSVRHQLVHYVCTKTNVTDKAVKIDFRNVDKLPGQLGRDKLILKVQSSQQLLFQSNTIKITKKQIKESETFYLYTLHLKRLPGKEYAQIDISFVS